MHALLISSDLMIASHATGAAQRAGCELHIVANLDAALQAVADHDASLVVLDLGTPGNDPSNVVPKLRADASKQIAVVAFGPHVQKQRLDGAREAGCEMVISRGQFHSQAEAIFRRFCMPDED